MRAESCLWDYAAAWVVGVAIGFLLIIIYFVYSIGRRGPCDGIFEQKAQKLDTALSFLKANGEVGIGSVARPRTLERSSPLSYLRTRVFTRNRSASSRLIRPAPVVVNRICSRPTRPAACSWPRWNSGLKYHRHVIPNGTYHFPPGIEGATCRRIRYRMFSEPGGLWAYSGNLNFFPREKSC